MHHRRGIAAAMPYSHGARRLIAVIASVCVHPCHCDGSYGSECCAACSTVNTSGAYLAVLRVTNSVQVDRRDDLYV